MYKNEIINVDEILTNSDAITEVAPILEADGISDDPVYSEIFLHLKKD